MKKILLIGMLLLSVNLFSQISGEFIKGTYGTIFKGTNLTEYTYDITICAVNDNTGEKLYWKIRLMPYKYFTISSTNGWKWMYGEKLWIMYSNGYSLYWVNNISTSRPNFTGTLRCKYCNCKGWCSSNEKNKCTCGHSYASHCRADEN